MSIGNAIVSAVLRSPIHRVLSGSIDLLRYTGRRSGRVITTPTQYACLGDDLVVVVGRPASKVWWRNFTDERDVDVLVRGSWRAMRGRAVLGATEPETVASLLDTYLERFPRTARSLAGATPAEHVGGAVVVRCRPR
jgi:hypothetical protein